MTAKGVVSGLQWEILLGFMEKNPEVANAQPANSATRQQLAEIWDDLTMHLNAMSIGGCVKTQRQWQDFWNDKKNSLNQKRMNAIRQQRLAVFSGNPTPVPKLILFTDREARMVKILTFNQRGQSRKTEPTEILTSVKEVPNMVQETKEEIDYIPNDEANSVSKSASMTEDIKTEMVSCSPAPASSPEASSPSPVPMLTAKTAIALRRVSCRVKTPYHHSVLTAEEIRLAAEDKILAKEERRLAEKERLMAAEDRRLAAEDRRLAAEDRLVAIEERRIAVQERKLVEEARRKASDSKITRELHSMSQKLTHIRAEFDLR